MLGFKNDIVTTFERTCITYVHYPAQVAHGHSKLSVTAQNLFIDFTILSPNFSVLENNLEIIFNINLYSH